MLSLMSFQEEFKKWSVQSAHLQDLLLDSLWNIFRISSRTALKLKSMHFKSLRPTLSSVTVNERHHMDSGLKIDTHLHRPKHIVRAKMHTHEIWWCDSELTVAYVQLKQSFVA